MGIFKLNWYVYIYIYILENIIPTNESSFQIPCITFSIILCEYGYNHFELHAF